MFLTSIFLFAIFSNKVAAQDSTDVWRLRAAQFEKAVYMADDPVEANTALLQKARCYKNGGLYENAVSTLGRIAMFAASEEERREILYEKALCCYLAADYDGSISALEEMGIDVGYVAPKLKSPGLGVGLTFLVPAGYCYAGAPLEGLLSTGLNAASVGWIILEISQSCWIGGILGGAIALYSTFYGAQERVARLIEEHNSKTVATAKRDAAGRVLISLVQ